MKIKNLGKMKLVSLHDILQFFHNGTLLDSLTWSDESGHWSASVEPIVHISRLLCPESLHSSWRGSQSLVIWCCSFRDQHIHVRLLLTIQRAGCCQSHYTLLDVELVTWMQQRMIATRGCGCSEDWIRNHVEPLLHPLCHWSWVRCRYFPNHFSYEQSGRHDFSEFRKGGPHRWRCRFHRGISLEDWSLYQRTRIYFQNRAVHERVSRCNQAFESPRLSSDALPQASRLSSKLGRCRREVCSLCCSCWTFWISRGPASWWI